MTLGVKHLYFRQLKSKNRDKNKKDMSENILTKKDKIISFDYNDIPNKRKNIQKINKIYINQIKCKDNKLYLL